MPIALEKCMKTIEDNITKKKERVEALHPRWVEGIQFVSYQPPPLNTADRATVEEWAERLRFIEADLHTLLKLPHHVFWCQVIFDETLHSLLDSYLRSAPRCYDVIYELGECGELHDEVTRLVFMTYLRMSTHKESKDHFITPSVFGEILYENFLFDIPKIFDLCVLYGAENGELLTKMVGNIFSQQSRYNEDLRETIPTITQIFDNLKVKCGLERDVHEMSPQKLNNPRSGKSLLVSMALAEFQDVIFYLADTGLTLSAFLEIHPSGSEVFYEFNFLQSLAEFYETVIPEITASLKTRKLEDLSLYQLLSQKIKQAKKSFLRVFNLTLNHCCIQPILENRGDLVEHIETFLQIYSSVLNERIFIADYESLYPFQDSLEILTQTSHEIDEMRIQYITDVIESSYEMFGKRKKKVSAPKTRKSPDGLASGGEIPPVEGATGGGAEPEDYQPETYGSQGACAPEISPVELDSLITSVKDLLPEFGEGFLEICLEEMNYDMEKVINALLEDRLPAALQEIDKELPRLTEADVMSERRNIHDYDEFDVFHIDKVDKNRIHIGKQHKSDLVNLDDKSELKSLHPQLCENYGYEMAEVGGLMGDMYDDEYDDTYDTNEVGADDADSADELTSRRPFTVPRILSKGPVRSRVESEEEEELDENKPKDEFIQNPAVLRQQAEERRRSKMGQGQGRGPPQPKKTYDVKGGPKGQGQSDTVLHNRNWKGTHKSSHANHNRKMMADKKRSKGMGLLNMK
ncbi:hypothetical protein ScPMuIL_003174 [Solemya velum]